jgi:hypothetical protein
MKKYYAKYKMLIFVIMIPVNFFLWKDCLGEVKNQYEVFNEAKNGSRVGASPQNVEDGIIQDLIGEFIADAKSEGISVDLSRVTFSFSEDLGGSGLGESNELTTLASCARLQGHLFFLKRTVNQFNLADLQATVYHELAHCVYGLDHDESEQPFPVIMRAEHDVNWAELFYYGDNTSWAVSKKHLFSEIKKSQDLKIFSRMKF